MGAATGCGACITAAAPAFGGFAEAALKTKGRSAPAKPKAKVMAANLRQKQRLVLSLVFMVDSPMGTILEAWYGAVLVVPNPGVFCFRSKTMHLPAEICQEKTKFLQSGLCQLCVPNCLFKDQCEFSRKKRPPDWKNFWRSFSSSSSMLRALGSPRPPGNRRSGASRLQDFEQGGGQLIIGLNANRFLKLLLG